MSIVRAVSLRDAKPLGKNGVARLLRLASFICSLYLRLPFRKSPLPPVWGKRKAIKKVQLHKSCFLLGMHIYAMWCAMLCVRPNIHSNTVEETAGILLQTPLKKTVPKKDEARVRLSGRALGVSVGWFLLPPRNVTVFSFDPLSMHQQVSCNRITPTLSISFSLFFIFFSSPSSLQFKCLDGTKTEDSRFWLGRTKAPPDRQKKNHRNTYCFLCS